MKRIICADDDPSLQEVFPLIFGRAGYEVTMYSNGDELLGNSFEMPDLFLLDKQLSGISGMEICRFLKSQSATKDIPVIIVSASPDLNKLAREAGADDYIEKPFKMKEMLALLKKFL
jgi:DNA-binding response OmpR family regulator